MPKPGGHAPPSESAATPSSSRRFGNRGPFRPNPVPAAGLGTSLISQPVEVPAANDQLRRALGRSGHPQIAIRFGYGTPGHPDLQREVSSLTYRPGDRAGRHLRPTRGRRTGKSPAVGGRGRRRTADRTASSLRCGGRVAISAARPPLWHDPTRGRRQASPPAREPPGTGRIAGRPVRDRPIRTRVRRIVRAGRCRQRAICPGGTRARSWAPGPGRTRSRGRPVRRGIVRTTERAPLPRLAPRRRVRRRSHLSRRRAPIRRRPRGDSTCALLIARSG
ncbi:hypothetical protein BJ973_000294 [Actinoplanes tereljensis]